MTLDLLPKTAIFHYMIDSTLTWRLKMTILQEIETKAMQLPYSERGHLVCDLLSTLEQPINYSDAYEKEIQQRIASIKSGAAVGTPIDQVFSMVENKYA